MPLVHALQRAQSLAEAIGIPSRGDSEARRIGVHVHLIDAASTNDRGATGRQAVGTRGRNVGIVEGRCPGASIRGLKGYAG